MQYRNLGNSDIKVSSLCLGTMTFGEQNSEKETHAQIEYALDNGINFIDTAELYPVPPKAETQGRTEEYIGTWLQNPQNRKRVILATKIAGPSSFEWIRGNTRPRFSKEHIDDAIQKSLKRLRTDYIDLYQLHWPERHSNYFEQLRYTHLPETDVIPLQETLHNLQAYIEKGVIRHIGLSNETPWGVHECLRLHEQHGLPRVQSIQNPYGLLNRSFEVGLAEMAIRDNCGLLAYSVLGFGMLSGKFFTKQDLSQTRLRRWPEHFGRYSNTYAEQASRKYVSLAQEHNLLPAQLAIAFVEKAPHVTSCIIGATNLAQLKENIGATDVEITEEILEKINAIEDTHPFPAP